MVANLFVYMISDTGQRSSAETCQIHRISLELQQLATLPSGYGNGAAMPRVALSSDVSIASPDVLTVQDASTELYEVRRSPFQFCIYDELLIHE